jgi:hypothetical protein
MDRIEREVSRFRARADNGRVYTVIEYQEMIKIDEIRPRGDPTPWHPGAKRLALIDGSPVNQLDPGTFQIVHTNQIIRKL